MGYKNLERGHFMFHGLMNLSAPLSCWPCAFFLQVDAVGSK